jgi:TolB-like protein
VRGLEADYRADIFACGAILFEMLTGRRAFHGESPADAMSAVLNDPPSGLVFGVGTPPALAHIVRRCLEKDAGARFQSARELGAALESASDARAASVPASGGSKERPIAVLPFANLSADVDNQYFSEGLAEDLINALTRVPGLRVASRTSSFRFRGGDADIRQIGRDLGAGAILEGSVRRSGARLRVTVQLTNTADGYHIWSERYDREMADVFEIQDEIVGSIVSALAPRPASGGCEAVLTSQRSGPGIVDTGDVSGRQNDPGQAGRLQRLPFLGFGYLCGAVNAVHALPRAS